MGNFLLDEPSNAYNLGGIGGGTGPRSSGVPPAYGFPRS